MPPPGSDRREEADEISRLIEFRADAELFGRFSSEQLMRGLRSLGALDAEQYCEVRFEDLVARPREVLERVAGFFDLPDADGAWRDRAVALVRSAPALRAEKLPDDERQRLRRACRSGNLLLGRA